MKILALDSSAVVASVALADGETLLAEYTLNRGNTHSESLLPMVESVLSKAGVTVRDIDLFAASVGPGSFTGVRIGVATLKGLAFGQDKPCVGVSTLEALAQNLNVFPGVLVCPVMNARRNQFYTALFRNTASGQERLLADSALSAEELDEFLKRYEEPVYLVGDGYELAKQLLIHPTAQTQPRLRLQSAASVAAVALRMANAGLTCDDKTIAPVYLRPCQAERERNARIAKENESRKEINP